LRPIIKGLPGEAAAKWIEQFGTVFREWAIVKHRSLLSRSHPYRPICRL
jgi:hypothetical protein